MEASPDVPPPTIADHLLRLLETKEGADVTFQVGQSEFAAHALVLSARSSVFRAMLSSAGGDGTPPAAERDGAGRRLVRIDGTGAAAFGALLHFVYGDVLPPPPPTGGCVADMRAAGELLGAADRYGMERMRLLCERALRDAVVDAVTAAAALAIADRHGSAQLKAFCVEYVASPEVLREVVRTEGYAELKASRPGVLAEILERVAAGLDKEHDGKAADAATNENETHAFLFDPKFAPIKFTNIHITSKYRHM